MSYNIHPFSKEALRLHTPIPVILMGWDFLSPAVFSIFGLQSNWLNIFLVIGLPTLLLLPLDIWLYRSRLKKLAARKTETTKAE